jgi:alpha-beta hydrolase superfamily lysophospholipase
MIQSAVHGLLDNAGSFEPLVQLLPPGHVLTCLDLPGHGRSSHLPPGTNYHLLDTLLTLHKASGIAKQKPQT